MEQTNQTFEESLKSLEQIVSDLEQGNVPLDDALDQFQKGIQLSKQLKSQLNKADELVKKIVNEDNDEIPFD